MGIGVGSARLQAVLLAAFWPVLGVAQVCDSNAIAFRDRAVDLYKAGDLPAAIVQIKGAIARCQDEPFYLFMLGNATYRAGRLPEAAQAYRSFLARRPTDFEAHMSLGFTLRKMKDLSGALNQWTEAADQEPSSPFAHAALAIAFFEKEDRDNAIIQCERATSLDARYADSRSLAVDIRWDAETLRVWDRVKCLAANCQAASRPPKG